MCIQVNQPTGEFSIETAGKKISRVSYKASKSFHFRYLEVYKWKTRQSDAPTVFSSSKFLQTIVQHAVFHQQRAGQEN